MSQAQHARTTPGQIAERKVLGALKERAGEFGYCSFKQLQRATKLDRRTIRRACRSLARKGRASYGRGLWTEDGEPAGSGYRYNEEIA